MGLRFASCAALAIALGSPIATAAQDRFAITLGAGILAGEDAVPTSDFTRPVYTLSLQSVIKRHFVVDGELAHWTLLRRIEHGPHDITGPEGRLGSVTGTTINDSHDFWNVSVNFLVKSTGPVQVFGGVGAGVSTDNNEYSQQSFGCSPTLNARTCQRFVNRTKRGPVPLFRGLGGIEVPLTDRLELVGAVRYETTAWEDRRNWLSATAGLRFSF
jgi:hypothetical protein